MSASGCEEAMETAVDIFVENNIPNSLDLTPNEKVTARTDKVAAVRAYMLRTDQYFVDAKRAVEKYLEEVPF